MKNKIFYALIGLIIGIFVTYGYCRYDETKEIIKTEKFWQKKCADSFNKGYLKSCYDVLHGAPANDQDTSTAIDTVDISEVDSIAY